MRHTPNRVNISADFNQMIKSIGYFEGMDESFVGPYLDNIINIAQSSAEEQFNIMAAAAGATGAIAHMYEWGTQGINKGRTNVRPNPQDPRARLWQTSFKTNGRGGDLTFVFKPSIANVPKPTQRDTGMSPEVIQKLSTHVFTWKARVMELGETVTIRRKQAKALLIPMHGNAFPTNQDNSRIKRGYTMAPGPITTVPGVNTNGRFNAFWQEFWMGYGKEIMEESIERNIRMDFEQGIEQNARGTVVHKPVRNIFAEVNKEARKAKAKAEKNSEARKNGMR